MSGAQKYVPTSAHACADPHEAPQLILTAASRAACVRKVSLAAIADEAHASRPWCCASSARPASTPRSFSAPPTSSPSAPPTTPCRRFLGARPRCASIPDTWTSSPGLFRVDGLPDPGRAQEPGEAAQVLRRPAGGGGSTCRRRRRRPRFRDDFAFWGLPGLPRRRLRWVRRLPAEGSGSLVDPRRTPVEGALGDWRAGGASRPRQDEDADVGGPSPGGGPRGEVNASARGFGAQHFADRRKEPGLLLELAGEVSTMPEGVGSSESVRRRARRRVATTASMAETM